MANIIKPKRGPRLPTTTDLVDGEVAINTVDKKLYSNIGGTVYELSPSTLTPPAGSNTQVQFNNSGAFGASSNFTFNSGTNALVVTGTIEATVQIDAPHFKGSLLGATQQECRNVTESTIAAGTPVYATGYSGNRVTIAPAEASNSAKMPAIGIVETAINNNSNGHCTILGVVKNINTNSYAINDTLYVDSSGGLTNVRPTGSTTLIQNIGKVVNVGTNGEILVMGPGRTNDVPNAISAQTITAQAGLYTNAANGIRLYDSDSSNYLRIRPANTLANDINFIMPADVGLTKQVLGIQSVAGKSATLDWQSPAYLGDTQTFTAKQTFTSGIDVTGSITGPGSGSLSISNGAGDVVITSPITVIGNGATDFTIDAASGTVDGSAFEWQTGDLSTNTLVVSGNIALQNQERIQNSTNGRVDIAPSPSVNNFGLSIDMTSKGTGARLTTVTGLSGTTLGTGVLESMVEFQSPKFKLTTTTPSTSDGGVLEYDGKVLYGNASSGRGIISTQQVSIITTATKSLNNATGNQNIFDTPQDVISLAANTTYQIEGYILLSTGTATNKILSLSFTTSLVAEAPTIHFATIVCASTGGEVQRGEQAFFNTTSGGWITDTPDASYNVFIRGLIKTVDAVTITPQIAFSEPPGGTNTVNFGTYISFIPVGSGAVASVGPWS